MSGSRLEKSEDVRLQLVDALANSTPMIRVLYQLTPAATDHVLCDQLTAF